MVCLQYPLPKPKGGREGDILLREDQLFSGVWKQRMMQTKVTRSMFGEVVEEIPGVGPKKVRGEDVVFGLGMKNPNASRGKRKGKGKKGRR